MCLSPVPSTCYMVILLYLQTRSEFCSKLWWLFRFVSEQMICSNVIRKAKKHVTRKPRNKILASISNVFHKLFLLIYIVRVPSLQSPAGYTRKYLTKPDHNLRSEMLLYEQLLIFYILCIGRYKASKSDAICIHRYSELHKIFIFIIY